MADPLFSATGYAVQIATANPDGSATVFMEAVADTPRQLTELLRTIALRVAAPVRLYDDNSNLIPLATYIVSIRDRARDVWVKADGVTPMPEGAVWSNIEVKVNVGSVTL